MNKHSIRKNLFKFVLPIFFALVSFSLLFILKDEPFNNLFSVILTTIIIPSFIALSTNYFLRNENLKKEKEEKRLKYMLKFCEEAEKEVLSFFKTSSYGVVVNIEARLDRRSIFWNTKQLQYDKYCDFK